MENSSPPEDPFVVQKAPIIEDTCAGTYWWCACGRSKNQPFCDGSHKGTGFKPLKVSIDADKKIVWCACKHSLNPPFCDGTHRKL